MIRKFDFIFFCLIALFLILRLTVLFSSLDKVYEEEELYRGTIAREIIHGQKITLWEYLDYNVEYFPGGVLTVGILAVPFFLLFGESYIALKLVGLTFALGTFLLWCLFLDKFFTKKTAILCALLFIFCAPFYIETSLITWGSHPEANFFTILSIFIFYKIFFKEEKPGTQTSYYYKKNIKYFFLLGLVSGFGLWFVQTYLLTIVLLFSFWFIVDKRFFLRRAFLIFCFSFLIGFSPAIYYALLYKVQIFNVNGNVFLFCGQKNILLKLWLLLVQDLPRSFLFKDFLNLPGYFFSYLYYAMFIVAFIYLLKSLICPVTLKKVKVNPVDAYKESLILTYPLLFFFAYCITGYFVSPQPMGALQEAWLDYISYRYMIPVMPFICVILAMFLTHLDSRKTGFKIFFAFILILGIIGNLNLISLRNFGRFNTDKGYSYKIIGDKVGMRITRNLRDYIKPFDSLEDDLKIKFYEGLGAGISWRLRNESIDKVIKIFQTEINPGQRPDLYRGWGTLFSPRYTPEYNRALAIVNDILLKYRPSFYEGFGRSIDFAEDIEGAFNFINNIEHKIDKIYQPYFYLGVGYNIGFAFKANPDEKQSLLERIDKKYLKFAYQGMLLGMKER